jgi:hypothetical protein
MKNIIRAFGLFLILYYALQIVNARALQTTGSRLMKLTLIPDYVNGTIDFDGQIDLRDSARLLDLDGLPLNIERQWRAKESSIWNLTGTIQDGELLYNSTSKMYHLTFGPIRLQPNDRLSLVLPFVNLDYSQIQPPADNPDTTDKIARQLTHLFTYSAGDADREIPSLDIPFTPVVMKADLRLMPLIGEALAGKASGVRLLGSVQFENIRDFDEFSHYCQTAAERLKHGDYRAGHLLYNLDFPSDFGPDVLNPIYEIKPTRAVVRSELSTCEYDKEKKVGQVQASFSGRIMSIVPGIQLFPPELRGREFADGNYSFSPPHDSIFRGVQGYQIVLGRILLAPGDLLTITVPNTQVQADFLQPIPTAYENRGNLQITYAGPKSFVLSLPYIPQTSLYASQFPSILRPSISLVESQLGNIYPLGGSRGTWFVLGSGLLLLVLSRSVLKVKWLSIAGWLLVTVSLFYGVRGSFGLLGVAVLFYTIRETSPGSNSTNKPAGLRKIINGLAGFALIALAVYIDAEGASFFRGLSGSELSPLTPLVLMILLGTLFLLLYGKPGNVKMLTRSDLPILILFLAVLSLFDALDKSLLAFLILCMGGLHIIRQAFQSKADGARQNEDILGDDQRRRWKLAFGNRLVPIAILILMTFAILNDLSSTYANDMQVLLSPLVAPVLIPLLVLVSVFLTFASIALLFVLVYPYLPFKMGYLKAAVFALFLFAVFLFGIGTDDRLIASLPNILLGRVIYYLSMPMLIGVYLDIQAFMQKENKRRSAEDEEKKTIDFQTASSLYFKNIQGIVSTLLGILSLVAPTAYAFLSSQPVFVTYFNLLERLILLPV